MKLLLDTHAALWWLADDDRLGTSATTLIEDPGNHVLLSAVVAWEIAIKRALGKVTAPLDVTKLLLAGGATGLPVSLEHAAGVEALPDHHADPFDRLLIAQALIEGATVITRNAAISSYDVATAW
jgi:PIN domain nuclease of toxin-antitoxin system